MNEPTREEILAEIDGMFDQYPPQEENDITTKDIMSMRGVGHSSASEIMRRIVKQSPDKYHMVKVRAGTC